MSTATKTVTTCDLCGLPISEGTVVHGMNLHARDKRKRAWNVVLTISLEGEGGKPADLHPGCRQKILAGLQRKDQFGYNTQVKEAQAVKRAIAIGGALPKWEKGDNDDDDY